VRHNGKPQTTQTQTETQTHMRTTKRQRQARFFDMMTRVGFNTTETETLLKAERTLQRWAEAECGTGTDTHTEMIERDETTGKPFRRVQFRSAGQWKENCYPVRDMEAAALRRVAAIAEAHPSLSFYHQGDPRGCALYVLRPGDVPAGERADSYYSRGVAVCVD
jgi:hypothetical protein